MSEWQYRLPTSIQFDNKGFEPLVEYIKEQKYGSIFILVDKNTELYCLPVVEKHLNQSNLSFHLLSIPVGEASKNMEMATLLWEMMIEKKADRKSLLINLGGGVITDLGGFVASVYKRGFDFINVPTSLLAMIDASVGGKCGIDFAGYKNLLGVFNSAKLTFIYSDFLLTLPKDELISGYAEMLKHALIDDRLAISELSDMMAIPSEEILKRSVEIKWSIVSVDPEEKGERKKLNFGHTIGHAIESYFLAKKEALSHGLAIAAGMYCEIGIARELNLIADKEGFRLQGFIASKFPKVSFMEKEISEIGKYIQHDKKNEGGKIIFALLKKEGECIVNKEVDYKIIYNSLLNYTEEV